MHTNTALRSAAAVIAAVAFIVPASAQVLLNPGASVTPPEAFSYPTDFGAVINAKDIDFTGLDFFNNVVFTGDLRSEVIQQSNGNLDFAYYVNNNSNSIDSIEELAVTNFTGVTTSVASGDNTFTLPVYPHTSGAQRSTNGSVISFNWFEGVGDGAINPGQESRYVMVFTNATSYACTSASLIDGGVTNVGSFGPASVPEPASYAVLGIGALGLLRRKRRS